MPINRVVLVGNLTRDPELRHTPSGNAVCKLGLANNRVYTDSQGQKKEEANFFDIDVWGKQAESCAQYLTKGRQIAVEGRLKYESWDAPDGSKRSKVYIVADQVQFLASGRASEDEGGQQRMQPNTGSYPQRGGPAQPAWGADDANIEW